MRKSIEHSQNLIRSKNLVRRLIEKSSITKNDTVIEIGAGNGIITEELLNRSKKVIAFEIDKKMINNLNKKFKDEQKLTLIEGNFLSYELPKNPYKVFSNIPFNITAAIIKKLTHFKNPPEDAYLIVQEKAAQKYIIDENKNSQIAVLLNPWFNFKIIHKFNRRDFSPKPGIDVVMLNIDQRSKPLIKPNLRNQYRDFIVYTFNQFKSNIMEGLAEIFDKNYFYKIAKKMGLSPKATPTEVKFKHWRKLFSHFINNVEKNKQKDVKGSYKKQLKQQKKLDKIHRTRSDKNWRNYRNN